MADAIVITQAGPKPTPAAPAPKAAPLRSPGKPYKNKKATHRVLVTALGGFTVDDEVSASDLPAGADLDNLITAGALDPIAK